MFLPVYNVILNLPHILPALHLRPYMSPGLAAEDCIDYRPADLLFHAGSCRGDACLTGNLPLHLVYSQCPAE